MRILLILLSMSFWSVYAYKPNCQGLENDFKDQISSYKKTTNFLSHTNIFVGSSSIRGWKNLPQYFPNSEDFFENRGFGGSQICHMIIHAKNLFVGANQKENPKRIIIYSGDNDLSNNLNASDIAAHYQYLVKKIRHYGVKSPIYIFSTKPSLRRVNQIDEIKLIGTTLEKAFRPHQNVTVINPFSFYFDENQELREELYQKDGLHLRNTVYDYWSDLLISHWFKESH